MTQGIKKDRSSDWSNQVQVNRVQDYLLYPDGTRYNIETMFHTLVENSLSGLLIISQNRIHFTNRAFEEITGYSREETCTMSPWAMVHPDERKKISALGIKRFRGRNVKEYYETRWIHKAGHEIWVEVRAVLLEPSDPPKILADILDITARKKAQEALLKREAELDTQSRKLEEINTALKIILRQRNEEIEELRRTVIFNVEKLIMPRIDELATSRMAPRQKAFVLSVKENLREIVAPYVRTLSSQFASLTPKQIEVINLIRQGKLSKEIAEILGVSKAAVDFHRHNIRKKLDILNKKVNLSSFLDINSQLLQ